MQIAKENRKKLGIVSKINGSDYSNDGDKGLRINARVAGGIRGIATSLQFPECASQLCFATLSCRLPRKIARSSVLYQLSTEVITVMMVTKYLGSMRALQVGFCRRTSTFV